MGVQAALDQFLIWSLNLDLELDSYPASIWLLV